MAIKRSPADAEFSKCIRAAANYSCEKCGTQYDKSSTGLHCSHNYSRRHKTIRWCVDNALSLCFHCHQWFGSNPADSGEWLTNLISADTIQTLRIKRDSGIKVPKTELPLIAKHYRAELKRIEKERSTGRTGKIEIDSYQ